MKKADSISLKSLVGINKECQNTSSFAALNVESLETKLLKDKIFLLCENPFTKEIMSEVNECFPSQKIIEKETIDKTYLSESIQ